VESGDGKRAAMQAVRTVWRTVMGGEQCRHQGVQRFVCHLTDLMNLICINFIPFHFASLQVLLSSGTCKLRRVVAQTSSMPWNFYKKVDNIQVLICCTQHAKPMWKQVESRGN
jgi:hypothetical protein